ncbi:ferritin family protein [Methanosarcina spelaei]|uniref:ferritin family protein n=1 Tax=Methanosarcina spelaei TaxID=1036679 RepID=UPI001FE6895F|nr:ferritin family protein [Methanosarcina spelaei]
MRLMTQQNLINAFGGESRAYMRYVHFANQAELEKLSNVARLFRAITHTEYIHAGDRFWELKHLDSDRVLFG